jgi:hypothetical protein
MKTVNSPLFVSILYFYGSSLKKNFKLFTIIFIIFLLFDFTIILFSKGLMFFPVSKACIGK